ncbi:LOW QUALITY PROTEIN: OAZ3 isoform 1 [Pan troglodytes]|uniref:OAZ3 isoform 1 n=1 Tax=Pan troglodytes TaxID=9598 RepID=A0A2J8JJQ9_PANTR|nr:LOW QUALITY PROTEIN: OAZ3 isoform 1 [Pan troglodytes]
MTVPWRPGKRRITYKEEEDLTLQPRSCLQCSESLVGLQEGKSTEQGNHDQLKELYSFDRNPGVRGREDKCGLCVCELPE